MHISPLRVNKISQKQCHNDCKNDAKSCVKNKKEGRGAYFSLRSVAYTKKNAENNKTLFLRVKFTFCTFLMEAQKNAENNKTLFLRVKYTFLNTASSKCVQI